MKFLHCADVHLDSPCVGLGEKGASRRMEILQSFCNMVAYASVNVDAMVIAGDLFDSSYASSNTVKAVLSAFTKAKIDIFLLSGNHDGKVNHDFINNLPPNVHLFGKELVKYTLDDVVFYGADMSDDLWNNFELDQNKYNVIVLHGDSSRVNIAKVNLLPIDYVAMGHYHRYSCDKIARGHIVYSGCLEPRGFDEMGDVGYVVVDTQSGKIEHKEIATRRVVSLTLDVSDIGDADSLFAKLDEITQGVDSKNYLNLTLTGKHRCDVGYVATRLGGKYYALRVDDKTTNTYDYIAIAQEQSIRGEFVRRVQASDSQYTDEIIEAGLRALEGV